MLIDRKTGSHGRVPNPVRFARNDTLRRVSFASACMHSPRSEVHSQDGEREKPGTALGRREGERGGFSL